LVLSGPGPEFEALREHFERAGQGEHALS
jgi:hypothetical protein